MANGVRPHPARGILVASALLAVCALGLVDALRSAEDYEYEYGYEEPSTGWWWFAVAVLVVILVVKVAEAKTALAERHRQLEAASQRRADLAWRADLGAQLSVLELLQSPPPQLPRGHQKVLSNGTALAAAGSLVYDHDFSLDFDLDDLFDPFVAVGKLALWAGDSVMSVYDSLPHRQRALVMKCAEVLEEQRNLAERQAAARPEFRRHAHALVRRYGEEVAVLERWRPLLPHRRRARPRHLEHVRRLYRLAEAAARL